MVAFDVVDLNLKLCSRPGISNDWSVGVQLGQHESLYRLITSHSSSVSFSTKLDSTDTCLISFLAPS